MSPLHKLLLGIEGLIKHHPTTAEHQEAEDNVQTIKASPWMDSGSSQQIDSIVMAAKASHGPSGTSPAGLAPFSPRETSVVTQPAQEGEEPLPGNPFQPGTPEYVEYNAGHRLSTSGQPLPDDASDSARLGYAKARGAQDQQ